MRCVQLSQERWIWLFADDDILEPECVAASYREVEMTKARFDVYRFNTQTINGESKIVETNAPHPKEETGWDFIKGRLRGQRASSMQEVVFSRRAYQANNGFAHFPAAWASDDAFTMQAGASQIRTIAAPRVRWRQSGVNISSASSYQLIAARFYAITAFARWLLDQHQCSTEGNRPNRAEILELLQLWINDRIWLDAPGYILFRPALRICRFMEGTWRGTGVRKFFEFQRRNVRHFSRKLRRRVVSAHA
jgi:hypothetical protein